MGLTAESRGASNLPALVASSTRATPTANGHHMNSLQATLVSSETPPQETATHELSVVAVRLVEAACSARDGDREATQAHIAHAVALLRGRPTFGPRATQVRSNPVLSNFETHVTRGGLPAWQLRRVFAHIEANVSRRIRIQELTQLLGLSASHFCRAFKCTFGVSPREYVLRRRIEVAQVLMLTTSEPLSSIAVTCGMCDRQHFARSFRRIVGETPSTW